MAVPLDVMAPIVRDHPAEWPVVDAAVLAALLPVNGLLTAAQARTLRQIAASRWFLLRNSGPSGEVWRCGRRVGGVKCGQIHPYFTLHCRPMPFNGLTGLLGVLRQRVGADTLFSAVALGVIEPITTERATRLYGDLAALGYTQAQLLGAT